MTDAELDRMERDAREVAEARATLAEATSSAGEVARLARLATSLMGRPLEADVLALVAEARRLRAARAEMED